MTRDLSRWRLPATLAAGAVVLAAAVAPPRQKPMAARPPASYRPAEVPVDAPELSRRGDHPVGIVPVDLVQPDQLQPLPDTAAIRRGDRRLRALVWYPAARPGPGTTYHSAMSGEDGRDVAFDVPGLATADARPAAGRFPLVVLAHGYGNTPEALSWLGENLASKGYLVVAPGFRDPPIVLRTARALAGPIARRPLDIAFVAREAQRRARSGDGVLAHADAGRTALIGYSMGGYGVLTAAGAPLSPGMAAASRGVLAPYLGGRAAAALRVPDVRAVVAIAPAVRFGPLDIWSPPGMGAVTAPTLLVVGTQDRVVGYDAVRSLFTTPAAAPRYLLAFREAGHGLALIGAPPTMRDSFWNIDWFEDAVWRKDRLLAVQAHFITAFLDRFVRDDAVKAAYLDGLVPESDAGRWPGAPAGRLAAYSPGPPVATVWKGFQPGRAAGMTFEARPGR